jgi:hypothetical protein
MFPACRPCCRVKVPTMWKDGGYKTDLPNRLNFIESKLRRVLIQEMERGKVRNSKKGSRERQGPESLPDRPERKSR